MNTNANLTNEIHYLNGLPNIQQENLFEAEGILIGAVFLAPELIHETTLEPCHFSQTVADIRAAIQKTKREHPNGGHLVMIDYLQYIIILISIKQIVKIKVKKLSSQGEFHKGFHS
ncbi:hypothetical protein [Bacillus sp. ISL-77]|uniref:hypothetical protein n=1 Tax=Bacillus sp. ISL-77 TaxID=2819138 RepID=UPI001BEC029D|nr:hypothetical protein [Bacillus sp. ISL-77]MBT2742695.1 hypothetical protein [Bacillus sp. ISL-77]